jgi:hypothetical protein
LSEEDGWLSMSCVRPEDGQLCLVNRTTWAEPQLLTFILAPSQTDWFFVSDTHHHVNASAVDLLWMPADWQA